MVILLILLVALLIVAAIHSDPYAAWSRVRLPFVSEVMSTGELLVKKVRQPVFLFFFWVRFLAKLKSGVRIVWYGLLGEKVLNGSEAEIIEQIHAERFDPTKPYVITGSHYSDLYMRNLGVFFNALVDPRLPSSEKDWQNRQRIALQTLVLDLEFLRDHGKAVTTITPLGQFNFSGVNFYTEPSDSLFAVLYTLCALRDEKFIENCFPAEKLVLAKKLRTQQAADELLREYKSVLEKVVQEYLERIIDPVTQLIRRDIHLSSARDGVKRCSSFYDNVIAWATANLAKELELKIHSVLPREDWREKILEMFWSEEVGIFRDDLSESRLEPSFSADSFIVLSTKFLEPDDKTDRQKLIKMIAYVQSQKLDQPFPLRYSKSDTQNAMHLAVKIFAPAYMGSGIWSHWGMEYVKTLIGLAKYKPEYLVCARKHLKAYGENIEKFGGYPELYESNGNIFKTILVKAVLHTGWVVNYEQAKMLFSSISGKIQAH